MKSGSNNIPPSLRLDVDSDLGVVFDTVGFKTQFEIPVYKIN